MTLDDTLRDATRHMAGLLEDASHTRETAAALTG